MVQFAEAFSFLVIGGIVCFLLFLAYRVYQTNTQTRLQRAEAFNKLLERFSSAKEFTDFLATEQGRKFLDNPMPSPKSTLTKIMRLAQLGVVVLFIGFGFMINAQRLSGATDLHYSTLSQDQHIWGIFGVMLGVGLLVTSLVSYILAKRWKLTNGNGASQH
jgi:hypothetical protein